MAQDSETFLDATTLLLGATLTLLDRLADISRHVHPPRLASLVESLADHDGVQRAALDRFRSVPCPDSLAGFRAQADQAADFAARAAEGLRVALDSDNPMLGTYRALRHASRSTEALYPLAQALPTVSQWFLEPDRRGDADLLAALRQPRDGTGVLHVENDTRQRGGFSVYVPENHDATQPAPVVVALHGGAGHGRLFLWTWLREARSRGLILVAPTATGDTWSLMDLEIDTAHLDRVLAFVGERWPIDPSRRLLTGMSDGGTFTLVTGLDADSPFTHLAPIAASFHPLLLAMSEPPRVRGLPIRLTHGALDWMFPVSVARTARRGLAAAGAAVTYREIPDLSHTYPREENAGILDWFLS